MEVQVLRKWFTDKSTVSEIFLDGQLECFGLEDRIRGPGVKVKGQTAIPPGKYTLAITFSARFKKLLPQALSVPMFEGIRIHPGNTAVDTDGCLLVGQTHGPDSVSSSRAAFDLLFPKLEAACRSGKVTIEYINVNPPADLLR